MTYPMGGTIDGRAGDHVLLAPPFIVEDANLEMIVDRLRAASTLPSNPVRDAHLTSAAVAG